MDLGDCIFAIGAVFPGLPPAHYGRKQAVPVSRVDVGAAKIVEW